MWDLPRPGLEPLSPELAGRFSTTVPPGKPSGCYFKWNFLNNSFCNCFLLRYKTQTNFYICFYSVTLLNSCISSGSYFPGFLGFSTLTIVLSVNKESLHLSFHSGCLLFFFLAFSRCLGLSNTALDRSHRAGSRVLFLNWGNMVDISHSL